MAAVVILDGLNDVAVHQSQDMAKSVGVWHGAVSRYTLEVLSHQCKRKDVFQIVDTGRNCAGSLPCLLLDVVKEFPVVF